MSWLSLVFGMVVGLSLGLTGGGGAIFAVPMLVYGLQMPPRDATLVSLAAVGATSFVGFWHRLRLGEVDVRTGLIFALAGMVGAPAGAWLAGKIPETLLLFLFAALMIVVAVRMWFAASKRPAATAEGRQKEFEKEISEENASPHREGQASLETWRHLLQLIGMGLVTGVLSGLFGVGGGFIIVPALVLFGGMAIHRAVGTSLMVIALVSVSGVGSQLWAGRTIPLALTALFVAGGVAGLFAGQRLGRKLNGATLQKVFVVAILAVAAFMIVRNLIS